MIDAVNPDALTKEVAGNAALTQAVYRAQQRVKQYYRRKEAADAALIEEMNQEMTKEANTVQDDGNSDGEFDAEIEDDDGVANDSDAGGDDDAENFECFQNDVGCVFGRASDAVQKYFKTIVDPLNGVDGVSRIAELPSSYIRPPCPFQANMKGESGVDLLQVNVGLFGLPDIHIIDPQSSFGESVPCAYHGFAHGPEVGCSSVRSPFSVVAYTALVYLVV
jgi:hypothetical protein